MQPKKCSRKHKTYLNIWNLYLKIFYKSMRHKYGAFHYHAEWNHMEYTNKTEIQFSENMHQIVSHY